MSNDVVPAHAGVSPKVTRVNGSVVCRPRPRGGEPQWLLQTWACPLSSPPTRG